MARKTPAPEPSPEQRCYACAKRFRNDVPPHLVDTRDAQKVYVGPECYRHVKEAGEAGWQPPKGGPRLWLCTRGHGAGRPPLDQALKRRPYTAWLTDDERERVIAQAADRTFSGGVQALISRLT